MLLETTSLSLGYRRGVGTQNDVRPPGLSALV